MQDVINAIKSNATTKFVKKRTILLYQGEIPRAGYILSKGVIKAYNINANGDEQLATFHVAGDVFPDYWLFGRTSNTLYYYEALTDCVVLAASKTVLQSGVAADPSNMQTLFDYVMGNYAGALMRITALEQSRAREKILFTLYYLLSRYGKESSPGKFSVKLGLTHTIIADMVGLTRETTAYELGMLKKVGIVKYSAKEYLIDKSKLEKLLGEDSFRGVGL
ncbi:MAG: Crp/Fnr family transcriptional regulator [Candidatus Saccharimonadales bacterium]